MEKHLEGARVWAWRHDGGPRGVADYLQFMATPESCDALIETLGVLASRPEGGFRTLPLRELRAADDPTGFSQNLRWYSRLRIGVDPEGADLDIDTSGDLATIAAHPDFVPELCGALEKLKRGGFDFALRSRRRNAKLGLLFWQPFTRTVR